MEEEIRRRLNILNEIGVTPLTQRQLRGGMQERLHRQEILIHGERVKKQKKKLKAKLSLIEKQRERELSGDFVRFPEHTMEPLDEFHEPIFRRIRSRRGFFNE